MAAAALSPFRTPRAFLSLCLGLSLLPGSLCSQPLSLPLSSTPLHLGTDPVTVTASSSAPLVPTDASSMPPAAPSCGSSLQVSPGPTSQKGTEGQRLTLECQYWARGSANVTWYRVCPPGQSCGRLELPLEVPPEADWRQGWEEGRGTLTFLRLRQEHSGLYFCRVEANGEMGRSCGTFLRVRAPPARAFLPLEERTKTQLICAQGVLLLLSAVGPGLLLLLRKRLAREQLKDTKGPCEGENLYEGLHLDSCSMYEDISGAFQVTYQDVGTPPGPPEPLLEKP